MPTTLRGHQVTHKLWKYARRLRNTRRPSQEVTARRVLSELQEARPRYVCVDYFDTLVSRSISATSVKTDAADRLAKCLPPGVRVTPQELFKQRQQAERQVSDAAVQQGYDAEFDLKRVAESLHFKVPSSSPDYPDIDTFTALFIDSDVDAELDTQSLNTPLVGVLRAISSDVTMVLVSDFYFPRAVFEQMLQAHGIDDLFDEVIISCDYRLSKASGRLYPEVLERLGSSSPGNPRQFVMIGDNAHSDGVMAQAHGFSTIAIPAFRATNPKRPE